MREDHEERWLVRCVPTVIVLTQACVQRDDFFPTETEVSGGRGELTLPCRSSMDATERTCLGTEGTLGFLHFITTNIACVVSMDECERYVVLFQLFSLLTRSVLRIDLKLFVKGMYLYFLIF